MSKSIKGKHSPGNYLRQHKERSPKNNIPEKSTNEQDNIENSIIIDENVVEQHNAWKFKSNENYFSIMIYGLLFVALATIIFMTITHWNDFSDKIDTILISIRPFIIAFFIAYILNPFVKYIDRLLQRFIFKSHYVKARKMTSIGISYIVVLLGITITILYITPELINTVNDIEARYSTVNINEIQSNIENVLNNLQKQFPGIDLNTVENKINEYIPHVFTYGTNLLTNLLSLSVSIVKTFINIVLAIVISCYMLADKNALSYNARRTIFSIFPKEKAVSFLQTVRECNSIFSKFIIGKSIDSLIIGILCFIVMNILKLDYAILLSVIVGITNMIPYFGPFIGAVPGIIIYLFLNPVQAVFFSIMIFALQQFDGLYLGPKILGGSTGLTPLWVIFGITVGGAYFGVFGMFIGVPVVAVIAYLLNKLINSCLKKRGVSIKKEL